MTRMTRVPLVTAALTLALTLAGCGGDDSEPEQNNEGQQEAAGDTWPLTGLPVEGDGSAETPYPALVVKMDNTPSSAPQVGLGSADLVVEEPVEGGVTRMAAFYHSDLPKEVGPVRSLRASDIGIVSATDSAVVTSGGAGQTIQRVKKAGIDFFSEGQAGFFRKPDRSAPYNLFNRLREVADAAKREPARPDDYLPWGEEVPKGKPATTVNANFGSRTSTWAFGGGTYANQNGFAAKGDAFEADNLLVLRVKMGDAGYRDPAGNPVPEAKLTGRGQALLFNDGRVVKGNWSKSALDAPLELSAGGKNLSVPAGRTWIGLVPKGGDTGVRFGR